ncbi:MAG: guanylate kinase [Flavobacteriales bacterium]|nr:guanylate kinase [Flavobacteriales bacterium]
MNKADTDKGKVVIFSAPSGAGKTTVVRHLLDVIDELEFSISATTRPIRGHEQNGVDYYFLTEQEFRERIANGDFLEYEEVYSGLFYGTLKSEVERIRSNGKSVIFDVDVKGGLNIKRYFGEEALAIFLKPPDLDALRSRLLGRKTEGETQLQQRLEKAAFEMTFAHNFDYILINNILNHTFTEAETIVRNFLNNS